MDYLNLNAVGPSFNGPKDLIDTAHGCQRGDGGMGEKRKGKKMYKLPIKISHRDVTYRIGNTVFNTVINLYMSDGY